MPSVIISFSLGSFACSGVHNRAHCTHSQPPARNKLKKDVFVKIRITEKEREAIKEYAKRRDTSVSDLGRRYFRRITAGDMKK